MGQNIFREGTVSRRGGIVQFEGLEFIGLSGIFCCIPLIWFIIGVLLCVWVYRDAQSRGMEAALWLLIVLITGILGLIVYLIVREEKKPPSSV